MAKLTHINEKGEARMVDVGHKSPTRRTAVAEGRVRLSPAVLSAVVDGEVPKGDVFAVARIAGIQGAKRTADLVPLCHPLPLDGVDVSIEVGEGELRVVATAKTTWTTGVEIEALTAVSAACLAIYDMVKALDKGVCIDGIRLLSKTGGKSGDWRAS
jgi:cyclic pyranopterin phosphate synthase